MTSIEGDILLFGILQIDLLTRLTCVFNENHLTLQDCQFQIINSLQFPNKTPNTVHENSVPGFSRVFRLKSLSNGHY